MYEGTNLRTNEPTELKKQASKQASKQTSKEGSKQATDRPPDRQTNQPTSDFNEFWKKPEIQDGGSKVVAVLKSWRNFHVMWRH